MFRSGPFVMSRLALNAHQRLFRVRGDTPSFCLVLVYALWLPCLHPAPNREGLLRQQAIYLFIFFFSCLSERLV